LEDSRRRSERVDVKVVEIRKTKGTQACVEYPIIAYYEGEPTKGKSKFEQGATLGVRK
jgi:hypothetical protein